MAKIFRFIANRQGSALMLSLEDEALDAVLENDESDINKENGVDFIKEHLNRLFKIDPTVIKYSSDSKDLQICQYKLT